jgi:phosphoglycerate dehydrogenase-like enzyme
MTPEAAKAAGAILVSKDQFFEQADILTIHLVLSSRTRGLVGAAELERMKPTAWLINASRGPIVEEQALVSVLKNKQIAGAAIDVFDVEPLPPNHPFRTLDNLLATPHVAHRTRGLYKPFFEDAVSNIRKWLDTHEAVYEAPSPQLHSRNENGNVCDRTVSLTSNYREPLGQHIARLDGEKDVQQA